ncbi:flavodoxin-like protein [Enterococcus casseliflavus ATCC 12755]|uniref:Flavodoxin-like protein n=1 Tax=Enterococcus casseliflavus ATCC 12755 TaxID=888066 RepID=F0EM64_ENTCA|nr:flavodoxin-like protein [Enterococcus casseliflavus ATCC 12755]
MISLMIKTLVVASHPDFHNSLSQRFFSESAKLPNVTMHFLDDLSDFSLANERMLLQTCDRLILQFPLYWYSVPAKMKAWIDTVWEKCAPALVGKEISFAVSTGVAAKEFQLGGRENTTFNEILHPLVLMAKKHQMTVLPIVVLDQLMYKSEQEKRAFVIAYQQLLSMPAPFTFDQKQQWFSEKLARLFSEKPQLAPLLSLLQENHETLTELEDALTELEVL